MEKSWVMMMDLIDKEHKEQEEACLTIDLQFAEKEQFVILRLRESI